MRHDTRVRLVRLLIVGAVCLAASSAMRAQKPGKIVSRTRQNATRTFVSTPSSKHSTTH